MHCILDITYTFTLRKAVNTPQGENLLSLQLYGPGRKGGGSSNSQIRFWVKSPNPNFKRIKSHILRDDIKRKTTFPPYHMQNHGKNGLRNCFCHLVTFCQQQLSLSLFMGPNFLTPKAKPSFQTPAYRQFSTNFDHFP